MDISRGQGRLLIATSQPYVVPFLKILTFLSFNDYKGMAHGNEKLGFLQGTVQYKKYEKHLKYFVGLKLVFLCNLILLYLENCRN